MLPTQNHPRYSYAVALHTIDENNPPYEPATIARLAEITPDEFFAVDMRVGRVIEVAEFPEARKPSWKVTVDFGPVVGVLTTSAQITNYTVEQLLDRQVIGALNLGTRRIAGFSSEFLILGALRADGTVNLLQPSEVAEPGAPIG
jgi:tRNA-binding protein